MNEREKVLELFEKQKEQWQPKASENIEKYRKGDIKITVKGKDGKPLANADVKLTQKTHDFRFGANIFMLDELETTEKNDAYKKYFSDVFNMATLPFYWDTLEPEKGKPRYPKDSPKVYRRPAIDLCIEFCEKHGIEPREHALAYDHFFPTWLKNESTDVVKREFEKRCSDIAERYADKIPTIEVTNEMFWGVDGSVTPFYHEPDFIEWCFKTAEKYFPNNKLCINEWTGAVWEHPTPNDNQYYSYIKANMEKNARIDAIGMQYHLFYHREHEYNSTRKLLDPTVLYNSMDMYSTFGKPLQITEITVPAYSWNADDEEIQAKIIENLYTIWFSHPSVEQIIYWNLVDGYAYCQYTDPLKIKETQGDMTNGENYYYGGLLRFDLSPKPAYLKIKELTQDIWHTSFSGNTDSSGVINTRGFYGSYEAEITVNGAKTTHLFNISKDCSSDVTIEL